VSVALLLSQLPISSFAATEWEYPELTVTPRSSERVEREAKVEAAASMLQHWTWILPAASTLTAGIFQLAQPNPEKDPDHQAALTGIGMGAGWLIGTWILQRSYHPYTSGLAEISTLPNKTTREQLTRERIAEQNLEAAATLASRLKWISVVSNAATSAYLISNAQPDSAAKVASGVSLLLSFTPLIFSHHWNTVWQQQQDYKKRIFGPIAYGTVIPTSSNAVVPALALQWNL